MELELEFELPNNGAGDFGIELSNAKGERYRLGYDVAAQQFYSDRTQSGDLSFSEKFGAAFHRALRFSKDRRIRLHVFFDVASAEFFADDGATVLTDNFFPGEKFNWVKMFSKNGKVTLV